MSKTVPFTKSVLLLATLTVAATRPEPVEAQVGYSFQPPRTTLSLRVGAGAPRANGDLFKFFTSELTLDRSDFTALALAADVGFRVSPRLDVVLGAGLDASSSRSEFRGFTDLDDLPIEQTTELTRAPVTVSARYYPVQRGRSLSRHAWVPAAFVPYISAGGGVMFYKLEQDGDWVDYETLEIFSQLFRSSGAAATLHVGGGAEWWLTPKLGLTADGRYAWGTAKLQRDFADFGNIDLRGLQVTTGLSVRF